MPDLTGSFTQGLIALAMSIPVWSVVLYFITRMIKKRDIWEKEFALELKENMGKILEKIDELRKETWQNNKKLALLEQDLSYAKLITNTVSEIANRMGKNEDDINKTYSRIRDCERVGSENDRKIKVRSTWIAYSFRKLVDTYNARYKENQVSIEPMPE